MTDLTELAALDAKLTTHERDLLLGECGTAWGSWMNDAGNYLCSLGLGTKRDGSIGFDTPLARKLTGFIRDYRARASQEKEK